MTFCGYHPAMSEGLAIFGEGLAKSTLQKARAAGRTVDEHVEIERLQLNELVRQLEAIERSTACVNNPEMRNRIRSLRGLALLCQSCYSGWLGFKDEQNFEDLFTSQFEELGKDIQALEHGFDNCDEGTSVRDRTEAGIKAVLAI